MKTRTSARLVLFDARDRLLLLKLTDTTVVNPNHPIPDTFWVTPGGKLEEGETFEEAVRREAFEECGIRDVRLGGWLWDRGALMDWRGEMVDVYERYYLGRVDEDRVVLDNLNEDEQETVRGFRWWSIPQLWEASTRETFLPPNLPKLAQDVLDNGCPASPIRL